LKPPFSSHTQATLMQATLKTPFISHMQAFSGGVGCGQVAHSRITQVTAFSTRPHVTAIQCGVPFSPKKGTARIVLYGYLGCQYIK
jgi:hypothetical protein